MSMLYDANGITMYRFTDFLGIDTKAYSTNWCDKGLDIALKTQDEYHYDIPLDLSVFCEWRTNENGRLVIISADAKRFDAFIARLIGLKAFL